MQTAEIYQKLPAALLPWYDRGHRALPWRETGDPYRIWLSEIMLQQTRVEAVKGYYARFLDALPDIEALAACSDDALMKLWEGLGYYSRARNLKKAAGVIVREYGGVFPREYDEVLSLPGIGAYTAGAICSIAFEMPTPAVDGNVLRLLSRLADDSSPIDDPRVKKAAQTSLAAVYPSRAGDFTQSLIELGATLCGPNQKPDCGSCPCRDFCLGLKRGTAEALPVKAPKRAKRQDEKTVLILSQDGKYALEKRPETGLLAGLWQWPNVSGHLTAEQAMDLVRQWGMTVRDIRQERYRKHIFTHIVWDMKGIYLETAGDRAGLVWFTEEEIRTMAALPTAFRQFWEEEHHV